MSATQAVTHEGPEVIDFPEPERYLHDGRPMREEYALRGAMFQLAYLLDRWSL